MIGFNKLISPKILSVVYGLTLVAVFAAAIFCAISVGIIKAILIALMVCLLYTSSASLSFRVQPSGHPQTCLFVRDAFFC